MSSSLLATNIRRRAAENGVTKARALCGGLLVAIGAVIVGAEERMTMSVSPEMSFAPGRVTVKTTIERDAENRALEVVAESPDFYRSARRQLDGDTAARTTVVEFRRLPLGEYLVSARLLGPGDTVRATVHRAVIVADPHVEEVR